MKLSRSDVQIILAIIYATNKSFKAPIAQIADLAGYPIGAVEEAAKRLVKTGLITLEPSTVEVRHENRIGLALEAVAAGGDPEAVCRHLGFREFEDIVAEAFELNGFQALTRYVFKHDGKRYEIDILACRGLRALCVDCKQWRRVSRSRLREAARMQIIRVEALATELSSKRLELSILREKEIYFLPVILTLVNTNISFIDRVPIVPVIKLRRFLDEFDFHLNELEHYRLVFQNLTWWSHAT
ncbi:MAG: restriction endonuclease [Candidatus Bathyarchaeia archaeon]